MKNQKINNENNGQRQALALLSAALVLSMSTWFSASAVIPQLRDVWELNPSTSAWLTIAVQIGFVCGAIISSLFNLADIIAPRHIIFGGAIGAAIANLLLDMAGGAQLEFHFVLQQGSSLQVFIHLPSS